MPTFHTMVSGSSSKSVPGWNWNDYLLTARLLECSLRRASLMSAGAQPIPVKLTAQDRSDLEAVTRKATSSQRDGFRARLILLAADGYNNTEIATELSCTRKTVHKWRGRFAESGRPGLADASRSGRPPIYDDSI